MSLDRQPVAEEPPQRARVDDGAGEQVRARALALLDHGDRHVAEPLGRLGRLLEQLAEPDRAGEPGRPGADDQDADLDPLVGRIGRRGDRLRRRERRRVVGRADASVLIALRARTSSVSFGTIWCRSPTTPRSANSKIGRVRVLVDRDDRLRALHADLVLDRAGDPAARCRASARPILPVWPTCAEYGYQPASTTARVAATAPPSAFASSSTSANFSGSPSPRPPATITSASSIDGPALLLVRLLDHLGREREAPRAATSKRLDRRRRRLSRPGRSAPGAEERRSAASTSSRRRRRPSPRAPAACRRAAVLARRGP